MNNQFVAIWDARKSHLEAKFRKSHPKNYRQIVKWVVQMLYDGGCGIDPGRIYAIYAGDHQGTLLFIISEEESPPTTFWYVCVSYGSCSGCDTLERIRGYEIRAPSEQQVKDYMTLSLHIVQKLKKIGGYDEIIFGGDE